MVGKGVLARFAQRGGKNTKFRIHLCHGSKPCRKNVYPVTKGGASEGKADCKKDTVRTRRRGVRGLGEGVKNPKNGQNGFFGKGGKNLGSPV